MTEKEKASVKKNVMKFSFPAPNLNDPEYGIHLAKDRTQA